MEHPQVAATGASTVGNAATRFGRIWKDLEGSTVWCHLHLFFHFSGIRKSSSCFLSFLSNLMACPHCSSILWLDECVVSHFKHTQYDQTSTVYRALARIAYKDLSCMLREDPLVSSVPLLRWMFSWWQLGRLLKRCAESRLFCELEKIAVNPRSVSKNATPKLLLLSYIFPYCKHPENPFPMRLMKTVPSTGSINVVAIFCCLVQPIVSGSVGSAIGCGSENRSMLWSSPVPLSCDSTIERKLLKPSGWKACWAQQMKCKKK